MTLSLFPYSRSRVRRTVAMQVQTVVGYGPIPDRVAEDLIKALRQKVRCAVCGCIVVIMQIVRGQWRMIVVRVSTCLLFNISLRY